MRTRIAHEKAVHKEAWSNTWVFICMHLPIEIFVSICTVIAGGIQEHSNGGSMLNVIENGVYIGLIATAIMFFLIWFKSYLFASSNLWIIDGNKLDEKDNEIVVLKKNNGTTKSKEPLPDITIDELISYINKNIENDRLKTFGELFRETTDKLSLEQLFIWGRESKLHSSIMRSVSRADQKPIKRIILDNWDGFSFSIHRDADDKKDKIKEIYATYAQDDLFLKGVEYHDIKFNMGQAKNIWPEK